MNGTVDFAVVSYAHLHTPRYAASIVAHPHARLVAITGDGMNASVARAEAAKYGVPFYDSYRDLRPELNLQAAYLGSETHVHRELLAWAANSGIDVICDKPLATNLDDARAMVEIARQAGIRLMVPFNPRFQLPLIRVAKAIHEGEAGDLVSIYAVKYGRLPTKAQGPQSAEWFLDPDRAGGGGFLDIGIHAVDALRWLAGAEVRRVYAHIGTAIHPDLRVDDLGTVTLEFDNGVVGVISAGWANPDTAPTWLEVRFEVLTTRKTYLIKSPYHDLAIFSARDATRRPWLRKDVDGLVDDFVRAILERRSPALTAEDAYAALAIVLAAYESARQGQVIELE